MVADDHVFGIGFEHTTIRACLAEDIAEHLQIDAQRIADAQPFREGGGVDFMTMFTSALTSEALPRGRRSEALY